MMCMSRCDEPSKGGFINSQTDNNPFSVIFVPVVAAAALAQATSFHHRTGASAQQNVFAFAMIECTAAGAGIAPGTIVLQISQHQLSAASRCSFSPCLFPRMCRDGAN